jgi:hypothetical protein
MKSSKEGAPLSRSLATDSESNRLTQLAQDWVRLRERLGQRQSSALQDLYDWTRDAAQIAGEVSNKQVQREVLQMVPNLSKHPHCYLAARKSGMLVLERVATLVANGPPGPSVQDAAQGATTGTSMRKPDSREV